MTPKLHTYPEYKPSGIEWLGDIPSHWKVMSGKWAVDFTFGFPADSKLFSIEKNGLPLIRIRDIYSTDTEVYYEGDDYPFESIINHGDILIGMDGDFNVAKWKGDKAILNQRVCKYNNSDSVSKDYVFYLLPLILDNINATKYATTVKHLSAADLSEMRLSVPPIDEQEAIAKYLDDVTGKVDVLMAEKQKQVEDLRAYRNSLITETVTRGLNPDAPLRPSGIEWLGDIPEHWQIVKIKYVSDLYSGSNITSEDIKSDGFPVFGGNGLRGYFENYNHDGDFVLIGRQGALCGNINYAHGKFWATEHAVVCHPLMDYNWFWFGELLRIMNLNQYSLASAQPGVSVERIKELQIPLPPLSEQQAMAEFLDEKTTKIDALIDELNKQLDELAEYKKAVISEAVTGKIDVRDWKPKN